MALAAAEGQGECHLAGITDTPMQDAVLRKVSAIRGLSYEELQQPEQARPARQVRVARRRWPVWSLGSSPTPRHITGQTIYADGGYIMSA